MTYLSELLSTALLEIYYNPNDTPRFLSSRYPQGIVITCFRFVKNTGITIVARVHCYIGFLEHGTEIYILYA
jgi:hypothetical protein